MPQTLSEEVAHAFLQTVVVLDDAAYMGQSATPGPLIEPAEEVTVFGEDAEDGVDAEGTSGRDRRTLDAEALVNGFAAEGLVCAVLTAGSAGSGVPATLRASRRADIVILDWHLGDQGGKALELLAHLAGRDVAEENRLPMVVVYSASPVIARIRDQVAEALSGFEAVDRPGKVLALQSTRTMILFIRKGSTSTTEGSISEPDLPVRLISEFAAASSGILRNLALGGVAAIREETHRVLARFHRGMDGPFLTHRILRTPPEDASDYATDLLGSEFMSVLRNREVGPTYAGRDAIHGALTELKAAGQEFMLRVGDGSGTEEQSLSVSDVMRLVDAGSDGLKEIESVQIGEKKQKTLHERLYRLLASNGDDGVAAHREFARLSTHMREFGTIDPQGRIALGLGSIVRRVDEYLLCIQPRCDAVRLKGDIQFVFSALMNKSGELDIVVREIDGHDVCLACNASSAAIRVDRFASDRTSGRVLAAQSGAHHAFTSVAGEEYIWLCDLQPSFAQRFVHRIANNMSRVGLNEFEWQRRQSRST